MATNKRRKIQLIPIVIPSAGATVPATASIDINYKRTQGIAIGTTNLSALNGTTFQKCEIDGVEIFPPNYETKMLYAGNEVTPNDKFYKIDERAENLTIALSIKDGSVAGVSYPYTITVYLDLRNPE